MFYFLFQWFVKITGFLPQLFAFRTRITYEDRSRQGRRIRGKAIVVANHHSVFDVALMLFVFPLRTLRCAVAEVMYQKNFLMSTFLKLFGAVRVERESYDFSFLDKMKKILHKNGAVEIYPEARLPVKGEEKPLPFKPSYIYLALESGAPIIPVAHNGKLFTKEKARVVIGTPIHPSELYDDALSEKENIEAINEYVRSKIIELSQEFKSQKEEKTLVS